MLTPGWRTSSANPIKPAADTGLRVPCFQRSFQLRISEKIDHENERKTSLFPLMWQHSCDQAHLTAPNNCHRRQIRLGHKDILSLMWENTHTHTDRCCFLSGAINSHSSSINIPLNPAFWSSIAESMTSVINPEWTLIGVPVFSQLWSCLVVR